MPIIRRSLWCVGVASAMILAVVSSGRAAEQQSSFRSIMRFPPTDDHASRSPGDPVADPRSAVADHYATEMQAAASAEEHLPSVEHPKLEASEQFSAWWKPLVPNRQRETQGSLNISLEALLVGALSHSAQIKVFTDGPLIRETAITEADATFDWTSFMEARWDDISEPVGNTLTTGGPPRFRDNNFKYSFGARRRNTVGGEVEISQRLGYQNNNSIFFIPNDQGTGRLTLSYTQPLLRGAGRVYNTSLTVLAQIDTAISQDEFSRQVQEHLMEVTQAYWRLYLERASLLQKERLLASGREIYDELESRRDLDALESQIVRARSAVESRSADLVRAEFAVRTAEARVRSLVNDGALGDTSHVELLPRDALNEQLIPVDLQQSIATALQRRPEVNEAMKQVKAASVRMNMAKKELLPLLNAVLETYVAGLEGQSNIGKAFTNQFDRGEPSYSLGLQYEVPIGNRAAVARMQRRRLELRRLQHQFESTVETMRLEVEVAVSGVSSAHRSMQAKHRAMIAASTEVDYLRERWKLLPGESGSASLLLEDLLDAQERLEAAEFGFLEASFAYNLAQVAHKRAIGTLLEYNQVDVGRDCPCDLPRQFLTKSHSISGGDEPLPGPVEERYELPAGELLHDASPNPAPTGGLHFAPPMPQAPRQEARHPRIQPTPGGDSRH